MSETIKGQYWDIHKKIERIVDASYDRIKDWVMDPRGYFLIKVDKDLKLIRVGFCTLPGNDMKAEVRGTAAIDIVNTLIREGMISSLQHAADMGIELEKAELALRYDLDYIQDDDLTLR